MSRFVWTFEAERELARTWLKRSVFMHARLIGCSKRTIERKAAELKLPARDAVARALAAGTAPAARITLPHLRFLEAGRPA